jgi:outer membrane protein assembly factor BamB
MPADKDRPAGPLGIAFAVIAALALTSLAFAGRELYERVRTTQNVPPPTKKLAPGSGSLASAGPTSNFQPLRIYSSNAAPPKFVDIDQDGVEDMIALLAGGAEVPDVYVAALNGKTLAPMWVRGPYSTQPGSPARLILASDRLVVARSFDTLENAHVLAVKTGGELQAYGLTESFQGACGLSDHTRRVRLQSGTVLDLESGTMTNATPQMTCDAEWPKCDGTNRSHCVTSDTLSVKSETIDPGTNYVEDDWQLTVGTLKSSAKLARPTVVALGATHGRVVWDEVLASIETPEDHSVASISISSQRMLVLTRDPGSKIQLRALDAKTGDEVWQDTIEEAGVVPMSVHARPQRIFTTLVRAGREEVRVYEADTGKLVGTINDVSSDAKPPGTPPVYGYRGYYRGGGGYYPMPVE